MPKTEQKIKIDSEKISLYIDSIIGIAQNENINIEEIFRKISIRVKDKPNTLKKILRYI